MQDNYIIATSNEEISYEKYMNTLKQLLLDCNHENYLSEIFLPLLRMCCIEETKIIPVFDDRKTGPKTKSETPTEKRIKTITAPNNAYPNKYVVPDYIFVPQDYSFINPKKPIIMVETKKPTYYTPKGKSIYRALNDQITTNKNELLSEIKACGAVIFSDGFTWMFLGEKNGEIVEMNTERYKTISFLMEGSSYYKSKHVQDKYDSKTIDLSHIDLGSFEIETTPKEWYDLQQYIKNILSDMKK